MTGESAAPPPTRVGSPQPLRRYALALALVRQPVAQLREGEATLMHCGAEVHGREVKGVEGEGEAALTHSEGQAEEIFCCNAG